MSVSDHVTGTAIAAQETSERPIDAANDKMRDRFMRTSWKSMGWAIFVPNELLFDERAHQR